MGGFLRILLVTSFLLRLLLFFTYLSISGINLNTNTPLTCNCQLSRRPCYLNNYEESRWPSQCLGSRCRLCEVETLSILYSSSRCSSGEQRGMLMVVALTTQLCVQKMYVMQCQLAVTAYLNNICYEAVFYCLRCQFYVVMHLFVRRICLVRHQRFWEELLSVFL